jgi:hypothetical protein
MRYWTVGPVATGTSELVREWTDFTSTDDGNRQRLFSGGSYSDLSLRY